MDNLQRAALFKTPEIKQSQLEFSKPDNDSIRRWISHLPKTNLGEMARQLYFALQELNQTHLSITRRLCILELLRPHVHYTCRTLSRHFLKKAITLSAKERKIANLTQALQSHLLVGYKIIAKQQLNKNIDYQGKKNLVIALHRAINESCHTLLRCYQLYCDTPKYIWRELHTLHSLAEDYQVHIATVEDKENQTSDQSSIENSYKKALLLSRARPNMLRQSELDQLFHALEKWSPLASLKKEASSQTPFIVDVQSDKAPLYSVDIELKSSDNIRCLDTQKLSRAIIEDVTRAQSSENISTTLLHHLLSSWGTKTSRTHTRKQTTGQISFAAGLSAAHFFLSGEKSFHDTFQTNSTEHTEGQPHFQSPGPRDIWDHVTGTPPSLNAIETADNMIAFDGAEKNQKPSSYPTYQASLIDISPGGYCACIHGEASPHIQTGEIISIRSPIGQQWVLAIIRWVRLESTNKVVFGIQLLSPNARPIAISLLQKRRSASGFLRCFYLPAFKELKEPAYLITPKVPFRTNSKVLFFDGEHSTHATLTECTLSTASFSQFLFTPLNNPEPRKKGATDTSSFAKADYDFNALWSDL